MHDAPPRSRADRQVKAAALAHAVLLPLLALIHARTGPAGGAATVFAFALALAWSANTVSHIHLHTPLFRSRAANRCASLALTLLLSIPQTLWRRRHLTHHAAATAPAAEPGATAHLATAIAIAIAGELAALSLLWCSLGLLAPTTLIGLWLPGTALGLALCALQGWGEHVGCDAGVDHRSRWYNRLWFNDGFHAAHHRWPDRHWSLLPQSTLRDDVISPWPPLLRWLPSPVPGRDLVAEALDRLETGTLARPWIQRFLLATHERCLRRLLAPHAPGIHDVIIVGGGLFPRSALLLARLLPHARLTLVDSEARHLETARAFLPDDLRHRVVLCQATFDLASRPACDLLVIPLAFRGDRDGLYRSPPARLTLVHDWLWQKRGSISARVSCLLLKRMNLVRDSRPPAFPINLIAQPCCPPTSSNAFATATRTLS